jgi:hypothetical protein
VAGLLLPFILDGVVVVPEFQALTYIEKFAPDSVIPTVEKLLLKEIGKTTTAESGKNECASIFEAIRLLIDNITGTENMRFKLSNLRQLKLARILQIDKARDNWKSHDFKDSLLKANQGLRICWYYEKQDKADRSYNNMNGNALDVSRSSTQARVVNSASDTAVTCGSASADWVRCSLSYALIM